MKHVFILKSKFANSSWNNVSAFDSIESALFELERMKNTYSDVLNGCEFEVEMLSLF